MVTFLQIPGPPTDERKRVVEDVGRDRRHSIDAAVVRTMKSRKVLQHQQVCMNHAPACYAPLHSFNDHVQCQMLLNATGEVDRSVMRL